MTSAINKEKKAEIVASLTELLGKSTLVYGMEYKGIAVRTESCEEWLALLLCAAGVLRSSNVRDVQVPDLESMRGSLPADAQMVVTKNRLLRVAVQNLESEDERARWEGLCGQKGQNAYVFAPEDSMREAVKAYNTLLSDLKVFSCVWAYLQDLFLDLWLCAPVDCGLSEALRLFATAGPVARPLCACSPLVGTCTT